MVTDFSKNAILSSGGFTPNTTNTPIDVRTRVATEVDILSIPNPYIGMIVYVEDTGKRFEVLTLKAKQVGMISTPDAAIDTYQELQFGGAEVDLNGYATEEYVNNAIAEIEIPNVDGFVSMEYFNQRINELQEYHAGLEYLIEQLEARIVALEQGNAGGGGEEPEPEEPVVTYGNIVLDKNELSVNEGASATFTVKLDQAPTQNQIVTISVNNGNATVNKTSLTFTSTNFEVAQVVTVSGVHLESDYNDQSAVITVANENVASQTVNVNIVNIDAEQPEDPEVNVTYNAEAEELTIANADVQVSEEELIIEGAVYNAENEELII